MVATGGTSIDALLAHMVASGASSFLTHVLLQWSDVTQAGIESLAGEGWPALKLLSLAACKLCPATVLHALGGSLTLSELDLSACSNGCAHPGGWEGATSGSLQTLRFEGSRLDESFFLQVASGAFPVLTSLALEGVDPLDEEMVACLVRGLPNLRALDVSHTHISKESLASLGTLRSLRHLSAAFCECADDELLEGLRKGEGRRVSGAAGKKAFERSPQ
jgi:hypothetical protein